MTGQLIYSSKILSPEASGGEEGGFDPPSVDGFSIADNVTPTNEHYILHGNDGRLLFANGLALRAYVHREALPDSNYCPTFSVTVSNGEQYVCREHYIAGPKVGLYIYGSGDHVVTMELSDSGVCCKWDGSVECLYRMEVMQSGMAGALIEKEGTYASGATFNVHIDRVTGAYILS